MQPKYSLPHFWRILLGSLAVFFSLQTIVNVSFNISSIVSSLMKIRDDLFLDHIITFLGSLFELAAMILFSIFILTFNRKMKLKLNIIFWLKASSLLTITAYYILYIINSKTGPNFYLILGMCSYFIPAILFCITSIIIKKKLTGKSVRLLAFFTIISGFINFTNILQLFNVTFPIIIFPLLLLNIKCEQEDADEEVFSLEPNVKHRIIFGFSACILLLYRLNTIFGELSQRVKFNYIELILAKANVINVFNILFYITSLFEVAALGFFAVYIFNLHKNKHKNLLTIALYLQCATMVLYSVFYLVRYNVAEEFFDFMRLYCEALFISSITSLIIAVWFLIFTLVNKKRIVFKTYKRLSFVLIIIIALIPLVYFTIWDTRYYFTFFIPRLFNYVISFLSVAIFPLLFLLYPKEKNEVETIIEASTDE